MIEKYKAIAKYLSQKVVNEKDYTPIDEYLTEDYVYHDREYASFYHFNPAQDTARSVFIGSLFEFKLPKIPVHPAPNFRVWIIPIHGAI